MPYRLLTTFALVAKTGSRREETRTCSEGGIESGDLAFTFLFARTRRTLSLSLGLSLR